MMPLRVDPPRPEQRLGTRRRDAEGPALQSPPARFAPGPNPRARVAAVGTCPRCVVDEWSATGV